MENIDWELLAEQKQALVDYLMNNNLHQDHILWGLVHLLDDMEDQHHMEEQNAARRRS